MEHLGVSKSVVGFTVPTGHLFTLLALMIIASKVAAGVAGAGLATLACGLGTCRPDLVNGVGVIVGIDRFSSEERAVTNFTGNAVATVLIGRWTSQIDTAQVRAGSRASVGATRPRWPGRMATAVTPCLPPTRSPWSSEGRNSRRRSLANSGSRTKRGRPGGVGLSCSASLNA
ncbi:hypothetical protein RCH11_000839 [Glaciihabitans sp. GrIS 2.15]|nr:hypothetical protein [Glaciihabitans sp. GrIS 2.15]